VSSASSFPLWVIDGELDGAGRKRVTQVPGANEELGWVNPRRWVREKLDTYFYHYSSPHFCGLD